MDLDCWRLVSCFPVFVACQLAVHVIVNIPVSFIARINTGKNVPVNCRPGVVLLSVEELFLSASLLYLPSPIILEALFTPCKQIFFCYFLQAWRIWSAAWFIKTEEREKIKMASRFYNRTSVLKVWRGLKNFKSIRKLKQLRKSR